MTTLIIPDIDAELERRLRGRAARSGRSIEEEARQALSDQMAADASPLAERHGESAWDSIQRLKARHGGGGDIPPFDRSEWKDRPVDFGE